MAALLAGFNDHQLADAVAAISQHVLCLDQCPTSSGQRHVLATARPQRVIAHHYPLGQCVTVLTLCTLAGTLTRPVWKEEKHSSIVGW